MQIFCDTYSQIADLSFSQTYRFNLI